MLFYPFKNYEEFKEQFVIGANVKRVNKILFSHYKDVNILKKYVKNGVGTWANNLQELFAYIKDSVERHTYHTNVCLANRHYFISKKYKTDRFCGISEEVDPSLIKLIDNNGHTINLKAGRFMRQMLEECEETRDMPETVKNWYCEEFASQWKSYVLSVTTDLELHYDNHFEDIYTSYKCDGDFGSCMTGKGFDEFYADNVEAKAAYLTNTDGYIVARCIVFTKVFCEDRERPIRLAERQYSTNGNLTLQNILVKRLIDGEYIDGYKRVGAGCCESTAFVWNDGEPIDGTLSIKVEYSGDTECPYMDSFKYLGTNGIATNDGSNNYAWTLECTDGGPIAELEYCEHRNESYPSNEVLWCDNTGTYEHRDDVVVDVDGNNLYYGYECEGFDGVFKCEECGEYFMEHYGEYSELLDKYFCCESCKEDAENGYAEENGLVRDRDGEWINENDAIKVICSRSSYSYNLCKVVDSWSEEYISIDDYLYYINENKIFVYNGKTYFDALGRSELYKCYKAFYADEPCRISA